VPFGLLTSYYLNENLTEDELLGSLVGYAAFGFE